MRKFLHAAALIFALALPTAALAAGAEGEPACPCCPGCPGC
jgi:hypothetical protein